MHQDVCFHLLLPFSLLQIAGKRIRNVLVLDCLHCPPVLREPLVRVVVDINDNGNLCSWSRRWWELDCPVGQTRARALNGRILQIHR
ncbi:hypothetical protein QV65_21060 [Rhodococcus erythropolis]|nr:hypothetical protein QV65_21060 [Rhodococcus erythropolis]